MGNDTHVCHNLGHPSRGHIGYSSDDAHPGNLVALSCITSPLQKRYVAIEVEAEHTNVTYHLNAVDLFEIFKVFEL